MSSGAVAARSFTPHVVSASARTWVYLSRRADWLSCAALMALAAAFRLYLLARVYTHIDSDQAVLGLMALHIQRGEWPVFFYGQPYTGSLEAFLAALAFRVFGVSDVAVRLPALVFSALFVGAVYWLGAALYGRRIALLSGLFLALGPALLTSWGLAAGANYIDVALCGTLLLLLAVRYPDLVEAPYRVALLGGCLAGLGLWLQPMMAEYLLAVTGAYVLRLVARWRADHVMSWPDLARRAGVIGAGAAIGMAPLLLYNLQHDWATLSYLYHDGRGGNHLAVALHLVTEALPIVLGLSLSAYGNAAFVRAIPAHPVAYAVGLILGCLLLPRLLASRRGVWPRIIALVAPPDQPRPACEGTAMPRWSDPACGCDGALALFVVSCLLVFVFSHFGAAYSSTSRPCYLLPLYTATPLALDCLLPARPRRRSWAALTLMGSVILGASLLLTLSMRPAVPITRLIGLLEARQIRVAYVDDYWLDYRITFESRERVVGVGANSRLGFGVIRIPAYLRLAARTPADHLAWVFAGGTSGDRQFRRLLRHRHIRARRTLVDGEAIYDRLSRPLRASGPYMVHGEAAPVRDRSSYRQRGTGRRAASAPLCRRLVRGRRSRSATALWWC